MQQTTRNTARFDKYGNDLVKWMIPKLKSKGKYRQWNMLKSLLPRVCQLSNKPAWTQTNRKWAKWQAQHVVSNVQQVRHMLLSIQASVSHSEPWWCVLQLQLPSSQLAPSNPLQAMGCCLVCDDLWWFVYLLQSNDPNFQNDAINEFPSGS